ITWDLEGNLEEGIRDIAELGYKAFEALNPSTLANDFSRRFMDFGTVAPPPFISDTAYLKSLAAISDAQDRYGIPLTSLYCNAEFINPETAELEFSCFKAVARWQKGMGCKYLVCGGGPKGERPEAAYKMMAKALERIGEYCGNLGIQLCYHPHLDTFVETREQLDKLCEATDPALVALCIDPAHLTVRGEDVVDIFQTYVSRIKYIHFKDVKGENLTQLKGRARYDTFAELGEGVIDFPGIVKVLDAANYEGYIIVELDRSRRGARASAEVSKRYLQNVLGFKF
ncbi:MAG: sugar phosphate isomerase/epimerase family protein, partial [Bacillota bacterium]